MHDDEHARAWEIALLALAIVALLLAMTMLQGCTHCKQEVQTVYQKVEVPVPVPCKQPTLPPPFVLPSLSPDAPPEAVVTTLWQALSNALDAIEERDAALKAIKP